MVSIKKMCRGGGPRGARGARAPLKIEDLWSKSFENLQNLTFRSNRGPPWIKIVPSPLNIHIHYLYMVLWFSFLKGKQATYRQENKNKSPFPYFKLNLWHASYHKYNNINKSNTLWQPSINHLIMIITVAANK